MHDLESGVDPTGGVALVLTTFGDSGTAERVVRTLLEERLIACGNILPGVLSLYWWEGEITREGEVVVFLKTEASGVERLFGRMAELHPYVVPELVQVPVGGVSPAYRQWVIESTRVSA